MPEYGPTKVTYEIQQGIIDSITKTVWLGDWEYITTRSELPQAITTVEQYESFLNEDSRMRYRIVEVKRAEVLR